MLRRRASIMCLCVWQVRGPSGALHSHTASLHSGAESGQCVTGSGERGGLNLDIAHFLLSVETNSVSVCVWICITALVPLKIKMWCLHGAWKRSYLYPCIWDHSSIQVSAWVCVLISHHPLTEPNQGDAVVHVEVSELELSLNFSQYIVLSLIYFTHMFPDVDFKREKKIQRVILMDDFHTLHEHRLIDISQ